MPDADQPAEPTPQGELSQALPSAAGTAISTPKKTKPKKKNLLRHFLGSHRRRAKNSTTQTLSPEPTVALSPPSSPEEDAAGSENTRKSSTRSEGEESSDVQDTNSATAAVAAAAQNPSDTPAVDGNGENDSILDPGKQTAAAQDPSKTPADDNPEKDGTVDPDKDTAAAQNASDTPADHNQEQADTVDPDAETAATQIPSKTPADDNQEKEGTVDPDKTAAAAAQITIQPLMDGNEENDGTADPDTESAAAAQTPSQNPANYNPEKDGTANLDKETAAAAQNPSKTPVDDSQERKDTKDQDTETAAAAAQNPADDNKEKDVGGGLDPDSKETTELSVLLPHSTTNADKAQKPQQQQQQQWQGPWWKAQQEVQKGSSSSENTTIPVLSSTPAPTDDDEQQQVADGMTKTETSTPASSDDQKDYDPPVVATNSSSAPNPEVVEKESACTSSSSSEEKKEDPTPTPTPTTVPRRSDVFQKSLTARRRQASSSRSLVGSTGGRGYGKKSCDSYTTRSVGGRSMPSKGQSTCSGASLMSVQSHLSLSTKVQSLLELAADVVNSDSLDESSRFYQKAIHGAGLEIMEINTQMGNLKGDETPSGKSLKATYHEDLRLIGIIIGLLRTKMAIMYTEGGDYERAVELCKGANQVHKHQPALKMVNQKLGTDSDQIAGLMILIIERLENAQTCLEQHKKLLEEIDLHSTIGVDDYFSDDDVTVFTSKEIVFSMVEGRATEDGSIVTYREDDTLELLSVHAAKEDKHDQAIHFLRDALQVQLVAMGMKHPRTTQTLIRVANMYRGVGNDRKNEELVLGDFEQTASVLRHSNLGGRARGAVLNDIAVIHMRRQDYEEAVKFLLDALRAYDDEDNDVQEEGKTSVAATLHLWRNLGESYMKLEKFRSAEGAFLKALDIQTDSRKIQNAAEELNLDVIGVEKSMRHLINDANIADTICRVGKARAATADHKRALDIFQEALSVINRASTTAKNKSRRASEVLEKSDTLCHTLYCIAESCCAMDDYEKALRMYNLSLKVRNSGGAYKNDKRKSSRIHCLSCFVGIGNVYAKAKEYPMALKQFKEALSYALATRVKEDHPVVVVLNQRLQEVAGHMKKGDPESTPLAKLEKKADEEIERGALDMATETLKELLVLRRAALSELKDRKEDTSEQVYKIACLLQTFGFVFAKNGDDVNAERAFKDAARLFKKRGGSSFVEV